MYSLVYGRQDWLRYWFMKTQLTSIVMICTTLAVVLIPSHLISQGSVLEGKNRSVAYSSIREADVMWMKRIWRRIDLRQKMNQAFYLPSSPAEGRMSFMDYLLLALDEGSISAFDPGILGEDDMFTRKLRQSELDTLLVKKERIPVERLDGKGYDTIEISTPLSNRDVFMLEIKEDWVFDKQRSVMEVRIIGICPMIAIKDETTGEFRGYKKLFWISFEESRKEMANWLVFNRTNDAEKRTYEQIFNKRQFESFVVKESNVYDRYVYEYKRGLDALLESEKIEQKLFEMEHDLWSY